MSKTQFTDEQLKAINITGSDLLVAAAAGSGKTAVLVERIIKIISNHQNPVDINRLLVVTFTDAAAAEMRHRISKAISKKLEENPSNQYLKRQFLLLNKSNITTIHSFCKSVVKQNFHVLGIDPSFRIADSTEIILLKEEIILEIFEEEYDKENNNIFLELVEMYGDKYTDNSLQNLILSLYDFSVGNPYPKQWLEENASAFIIKDDIFEESIWIKLLKEYINKVIKGVISSAEEAIYLCNLPNGPSKYIDTLNEDINISRLILKSISSNFDDMFNIISNVEFLKLKTISKNDEVDVELQNKVKDIRNKEIKDVIKSIKDEVFFKNPKEIKEDLKKLYPIICKLKDLTLNFLAKFSHKKREKNIVDFNDLEHFCIEAIENKDVLETLQSNYVEILIDEYQDSNLTQELILSSIVKKGISNRFMVGDIKQSIYKFRGAKPELFLEKYESFSKSNNNEIKIDLSKNFRSRDIVLNGINFIFKQLMSKEVGDIVYDSNASLYYGANFPDKEDFNVSEDIELHITVSKLEHTETNDIDTEIKELSNIALEARLIAKRILNLTSGTNKLYINENGSYRQANYKDIVILTRSMSTVAEILVEELKNYGIPAFAETSTGFFENTEIMVMLSLLHIIDNPRQDIHLISVLRSPIYSINPDDLLNIRGKLQKGTFYDCIIEFLSLDYEETNDINIKNTLKLFMENLLNWRKIASYTSISNLVSILFEETRYFDYVGAMSGGAIRQGNLQVLQSYATKFEETSYKGLFHFIKYIEKHIKRNTQIGNAKIFSENENVVRIMSIHKSKGLEFPIVFVSMLGRKFNRRDESNNIIFHKDYGFGPKYIDIHKRTKCNTLASFTLSNKIHEESYSEELRILYVALTRAKEKLILTGCIGNLNNNLSKWARFTSNDNIQLPSKYLLKCSTFLDFIAPCIMRHEDGINLLEKTGSFLQPKNEVLLRDLSKWSIYINNINDIEIEINNEYQNKNIFKENLDNLISDIDISHLEKTFNFQYPNKSLISLPSTISISEIKRNFYKQLSEELETQIDIFKPTVLKEPEFLKQNRGLTSVEVGTAIHTVMEHLDLNIHKDKEGIISLLKSLQLKNIITEEEKKHVPINKILEFIKSDIAKRMLNAKYIKKETSFVMEIKASEAYLQTNSKLDKVMVHGIIDCYFEEDNGNIVLLDYKSDYVTNSTVELIKDKYKIQISIYKKALENVTNKNVSQCIIYLFAMGQSVLIEDI